MDSGAQELAGCGGNVSIGESVRISTYGMAATFEPSEPISIDQMLNTVRDLRVFCLCFRTCGRIHRSSHRYGGR